MSSTTKRRRAGGRAGAEHTPASPTKVRVIFDTRDSKFDQFWDEDRARTAFHAGTLDWSLDNRCYILSQHEQKRRGIGTPTA